MAAHWGLALDHSEYLMYYGGAHAAPRVSVSLRPAQETDRSALEVLYSSAFPGNGGKAAWRAPPVSTSGERPCLSSAWR